MNGQEWQDHRGEDRHLWKTSAAFWDDDIGEQGNDIALKLVFPAVEQSVLELDWKQLSEIPPVLAVRLRLAR